MVPPDLEYAIDRAYHPFALRACELEVLGELGAGILRAVEPSVDLGQAAFDLTDEPDHLVMKHCLGRSNST